MQGELTDPKDISSTYFVYDTINDYSTREEKMKNYYPDNPIGLFEF